MLFYGKNWQIAEEKEGGEVTRVKTRRLILRVFGLISRVEKGRDEGRRNFRIKVASVYGKT